MPLTLRRAPSERFDQRKSVPSGVLFVGRPDFVCALAGGGPLSAQDFKLKNRAAFGVGPPEAVRFFLRLFLFRDGPGVLGGASVRLRRLLVFSQ